MSAEQDVTRLLSELAGGDEAATAQLLPLIYQQLRDLASRYLSHERADHTLQATALVHEAFIKLAGQDRAQYKNRAHFFAVAAQAMRRILVDYSRRHQAAKRGGDYHRISLEEMSTVFESDQVDLLAVDDALTRLATIDRVQFRIVELRFYGGLTIDETAKVLRVSTAKVKREWRMAQAWLHREISAE